MYREDEFYSNHRDYLRETDGLIAPPHIEYLNDTCHVSS